MTHDPASRPDLTLSFSGTRFPQSMSETHGAGNANSHSDRKRPPSPDRIVEHAPKLASGDGPHTNRESRQHHTSNRQSHGGSAKEKGQGGSTSAARRQSPHRGEAGRAREHHSISPRGIPRLHDINRDNSKGSRGLLGKGDSAGHDVEVSSGLAGLSPRRNHRSRSSRSPEHALTDEDGYASADDGEGHRSSKTIESTSGNDRRRASTSTSWHRYRDALDAGRFTNTADGVGIERVSRADNHDGHSASRRHNREHHSSAFAEGAGSPASRGRHAQSSGRQHEDDFSPFHHTRDSSPHLRTNRTHRQSTLSIDLGGVPGGLSEGSADGSTRHKHHHNRHHGDEDSKKLTHSLNRSSRSKHGNESLSPSSPHSHNHRGTRGKIMLHQEPPTGCNVEGGDNSVGSRRQHAHDHPESLFSFKSHLLLHGDDDDTRCLDRNDIGNGSLRHKHRGDHSSARSSSNRHQNDHASLSSRGTVGERAIFEGLSSKLRSSRHRHHHHSAETSDKYTGDRSPPRVAWDLGNDVENLKSSSTTIDKDEGRGSSGGVGFHGTVESKQSRPRGHHGPNGVGVDSSTSKHRASHPHHAESHAHHHGSHDSCHRSNDHHREDNVRSGRSAQRIHSHEKNHVNPHRSESASPGDEHHESSSNGHSSNHRYNTARDSTDNDADSLKSDNREPHGHRSSRHHRRTRQQGEHDEGKDISYHRSRSHHQSRSSVHDNHDAASRGKGQYVGRHSGDMHSTGPRKKSRSENSRGHHSSSPHRGDSDDASSPPPRDHSRERHHGARQHEHGHHGNPRDGNADETSSTHRHSGDRVYSGGDGSGSPYHENMGSRRKENTNESSSPHHRHSEFGEHRSGGSHRHTTGWPSDRGDGVENHYDENSPPRNSAAKYDERGDDDRDDRHSTISDHVRHGTHTDHGKSSDDHHPRSHRHHRSTNSTDKFFEGYLGHRYQDNDGSTGRHVKTFPEDERYDCHHHPRHHRHHESSGFGRRSPGPPSDNRNRVSNDHRSPCRSSSERDPTQSRVSGRQSPVALSDNRSRVSHNHGSPRWSSSERDRTQSRSNGSGDHCNHHNDTSSRVADRPRRSAMDDGGSDVTHHSVASDLGASPYNVRRSTTDKHSGHRPHGSDSISSSSRIRHRHSHARHTVELSDSSGVSGGGSHGRDRQETVVTQSALLSTQDDGKLPAGYGSLRVDTGDTSGGNITTTKCSLGGHDDKSLSGG